MPLIGALLLAGSMDACLSDIPPDLTRQLATEYPAYRLPMSTESAWPSATAESRRACPFVAKGDFDGDGRDDMAVAMPARTGAHVLVVVGLRLAEGWRSAALFEDDTPLPGMYVASAPAGRSYRQTRVFDREQVQLPAVRSLKPRHTGVAVGKGGTWEICFFLEGGRWLRVYTAT